MFRVDLSEETQVQVCTHPRFRRRCMRGSPAACLSAAQLGMVDEAAQQAQREEAAAKAVLQAAQAAQKRREALTAQEVRI